MKKSIIRNHKRRANRKYFKTFKLTNFPLEILYCILEYCDHRSVLSMFLTVKGLYSSLTEIELFNLKLKMCKTVFVTSVSKNIIASYSLLPNLQRHGICTQYKILKEGIFLSGKEYYDQGKKDGDCIYFSIRFDDKIVHSISSIESYKQAVFQHCEESTAKAKEYYNHEFYDDVKTLINRKFDQWFI